MKTRKNPINIETPWMSTHDKIEGEELLAEMKAVKCIRSWQLRSGGIYIGRDFSFTLDSDETTQLSLSYRESGKAWSARIIDKYLYSPKCKTAQEAVDWIEDQICDPLEILAHRARQNPRKAKKNPFVISDIDAGAGITETVSWPELSTVKTHLTWTLVGRRAARGSREFFWVHGREKFYLLHDPESGWYFAPMLSAAQHLDVSKAPWISAVSAQDVLDQIEELVADPLELLAWKTRPNPRKGKQR